MYRILIADDESTIRNGLVHCVEWEKAGCEIVYVAADGQDALDHIPSCKPDVILSDIRMPRVDGLELSRIVQQDHPNIKVVLLTGYQDFAYAQLAIRYQVTDYLLKPVSPQKLLEAVGEIVSEFEHSQKVSNYVNQLEKGANQTDLLKEQLFYYKLLDGAKPNNAILEDSSKKRIEHFVLVEFHLVKGNESNQENLGKIQEIIESALKEFRYVPILKGQHTIYTIVSTDLSAGGTTEKNIFEKCEEIAEIVDDFTNLIICISISKPCESLSQIMDAKRETHRNFRLLSSESTSVVLKSNSKTDFSSISTGDVRQFINEFIQALKKYNRTQALEVVDAVFEYAKKHKVSYIELQNMCFVLLNIAIRDLIDYSCPNEQMEVLKNTYYQELVTCETFQQLYQTFNEIVALIITGIKNQNKDSMTIIANVIQYILQHYGDDLTLEKLAAEVHVSNSYLSRLFKKEQGMTLSNYIQTIRLQEAKELLSSTNLKTYEIAEKVGISDPVYFSKLFKRAEGLSPKEFRQNRYGKTV